MIPEVYIVDLCIVSEQLWNRSLFGAPVLLYSLYLVLWFQLYLIQYLCLIHCIVYRQPQYVLF